MDSPSNGSANYKLEVLQKNNFSLDFLTPLSRNTRNRSMSRMRHFFLPARIFWMRCVQARSM